MGAGVRSVEIAAWEPLSASMWELVLAFPWAWFSIKESILLRNSVDCHSPIHPCVQVQVGHGRPIIVIARISFHDARIGLVGKRRDYVRDRHVPEPTRAIVGRLRSPDPVARDRWIALGAALCLALIVPRGEQIALCGD